jgi:tRNA-2-methylthio-N6-dimethylallyladenosine synthase
VTEKLYVKTFGCQMNVYDSQRMAEALGGLAETSAMEEADIILFNTCHIRDKAAEKVYSDLGRVRQLKASRQRAGKRTIVAVAGCVAQAEGAEIVRRAPVVDVVVGPQGYHRLGEMIALARAQARQVVDTQFPVEDKFTHLPQRRPARSVSALLTVQEGCDRFCSFCVVPYTRGAEFSRPVADIEREARQLAASGVREITLLGQNVNAYHGALCEPNRPPKHPPNHPAEERCSLAQLIDRLAEISGIARLRYTTSHPCDMAEDLLTAHRRQLKLMPYLHLPLQSGSDRVLAAMNRGHTVAEYLALAARIRAERPDLALSTDLIVGFPGETDREFRATLAAVARVGFAQAYAFMFSPRPGTPAATLPDQVPEAEKRVRLHALQKLLLDQQTTFNKACVGRTMRVLFERPGRHPGQLAGRSPYQQAVHAPGAPSLIGRIAEVEIVGLDAHSLAGRVRRVCREEGGNGDRST